MFGVHLIRASRRSDGIAHSLACLWRSAIVKHMGADSNRTVACAEAQDIVGICVCVHGLCLHAHLYVEGVGYRMATTKASSNRRTPQRIDIVCVYVWRVKWTEAPSTHIYTNTHSQRCRKDNAHTQVIYDVADVAANQHNPSTKSIMASGRPASGNFFRQQ